jgi:hypothetical protein
MPVAELHHREPSRTQDQDLSHRLYLFKFVLVTVTQNESKIEICACTQTPEGLRFLLLLRREITFRS